MPSAGSAIIETLASAGVRRFYTVPGESFLELIDAVERHSESRLISARHESGAGFMAEADGKLTGLPAVAMATRGVGAANLSISVHTAYQDSTPMVVILGQVESEHLHKEGFQEIDLTAFYTPITKWAITASRADRLPELVSRGLRIATSGRPGPVMIAIPADLLAVELPNGRPDDSVPPMASPAPSPEEIEQLVKRLSDCERPVMIAGGGAQGARSELVAVAEAYNLGVYAAFRRQDVFPNDHPLYLGHLGLGTPPETLEALKVADLALIVGCRMSEVTTQGYQLPLPGTEVVQVDLEPASVGAVVPLVQGIVADARQVLRPLADRKPQRPAGSWEEQHNIYLESSEVGESRSNEGVDPAQIVRAMSRVLPDDTILTNDAGNFSGFLHRYWCFRHARTQLGPTSGAMGYAIPAAVGAKLAQPDRTVVAVVGDGGFLMTGGEIEVAVRTGANILVVALRNGLYGTIAMHQAREFGHIRGNEIGAVDLAGYARSLGAEAFTVDSEEDLEPTLKQASNTEGVVVLDIATDPDLITPTSRLSELRESGGQSQIAKKNQRSSTR